MAQSAMGRLFRWSSTTRHPMVTFSQARNQSTLVAPRFSQTESTQLNDALDHWRQSRFLIYALPQRQRQSLFKESHHERLTVEPITVSISENEQFTLKPMAFNQMPSKSEFPEVLELMEKANDYSNLIPFLIALRKSGIKVQPSRWQYIIRKAAEAGKLSAILECAKQRQHSGFPMHDLPTVRVLFEKINALAFSENSKHKDILAAEKLAKMAVDIMDCYPPNEQPKPAENPRNQPFVISTLLHLSASRTSQLKADNKAGLKRQSAETLGYLQKYLAALPLVNLSPTFSTETERDQWLHETSAARTALSLSLSAISGLPTQLSSKAEAHVKELKAIASQLKSKKRAKVAPQPTES
ncbi:hypothetical protein N7495_000994 [Penicillium taxi]|uniref:uncharacterized protein n=1 Tax=Penicillium taxi TaxID=168475 RepID=UPI00254558EA|nr:uncharacterized protein N7495_000994 [Penicillium taxi]KAJ5908312.1 hypothetical protein N7495_000994 [Penicillium taxi]